jgi:hypothetical protein
MSDKKENLPIITKKRGRKPKNKIIEQKIETTPANSEDEPIIAHLPISLDDVVNISNDEILDESIFIKNEKDLMKKTTQPETSKNIINQEETMLKHISQKLIETEKIFMLGKNVNKVNVHNIKFKPGSKCLWCKYGFETPAIELPEDYYNNIFYCIGNFCSWNCAKAYNIDLNDSTTWKRESLLNLLYYKTYGNFVEMSAAPSWLLLEDYGGIMKIDEFRNLFFVNNKDYLVLHPPLVTRQLQIEESYKKNISNKNANNKQDMFESELVLKRSKPIESNSYNLEKTMGLKRKVKKNDVVV